MTYANGDQAQHLDLTFRCAWVSGEPYPSDGENTDAAGFRLEDVPELPGDFAERIRLALEADGAARFDQAPAGDAVPLSDGAGSQLL
jgi:hypothetical protein